MSTRPSTSSTTHLPPMVNPTVPLAIHNLANPPPTLIDSQLPNYLLPCVLTLLKESTTHVMKKKRREEESLREEGLIPPKSNGNGKGKSIVDGQFVVEETEEEEEKRLIQVELGQRIERIGLMAGGYVAEKLTLARAPLGSHLDIIKFICKDLFLYVYSKQIDNLRTNHRGTFVLQSHAFPPLVPLSSYKGSAADMEAAKIYLLYPQALIQGALTRLGMPAIVTAESSGLPQCTFQIRVVKNTPGTTTPAISTPTPGGMTGSLTSANKPTSAVSSVPASTGLGIAGAS